jgi:hypothetical protein
MMKNVINISNMNEQTKERTDGITGGYLGIRGQRAGQLDRKR